MELHNDLITCTNLGGSMATRVLPFMKTYNQPTSLSWDLYNGRFPTYLIVQLSAV